jgi:hypothetical protein
LRFLLLGRANWAFAREVKLAILEVKRFVERRGNAAADARRASDDIKAGHARSAVRQRARRR